MTQKVKMHAKNIDNQYVQVYPETVASQVIVEATGQTLEQMVKSGNLGGSGGKGSIKEFVVVATTNSQKVFSFEDDSFNVQSDHVTVHLNGEFLHRNEEYTVETTGKVVLTTGVLVGDKIHITIEKLSAGGSGGPVTAEAVTNAIPQLKRITSALTFYVNVNTGSDENDGLTPGTPFKTIANAVNRINHTGAVGYESHTINLADGLYREKINITAVGNSSVVIKGSGPNTIIEGRDLDFGVFELHRLSYIELSDLTIRPINTSSDWGLLAVNVTDVTDLQITDTVIIDFSMADLTGVIHGGIGVHAIKTYKGSVNANFINSNLPVHLSNCELVINIKTDIDTGFIALYDSNVTVNYRSDNTCRIQNHGNSSVVRNKVTGGSVVDRGSNENGSYAIYGDRYATSYVYKAIELPEMVPGTVMQVGVSYPISFNPSEGHLYSSVSFNGNAQVSVTMASGDTQGCILDIKNISSLTIGNGKGFDTVYVGVQVYGRT